MTLGKLRGLLYKAARLIGDVQAVRHHRVIKRVHNRIVQARKVHARRSEDPSEGIADPDGEHDH